MRRRNFLKLAGCVPLFPRVAWSQGAQKRSVALLSSTSPEGYEPFARAIRQALGVSGYAIPRDVEIEERWANGRYDLLIEQAKDLAARKPDVVIAIAPPAARAAMAASSSIPIVLTTSGDPVALGLVSSLHRPGGNATGIDLMLFSLGPKRLELLNRIVPGFKRVCLFGNPKNPSTERSALETEAAARQFGKEAIRVSASTTEQIDLGFVRAREQSCDAICVEADPYLLAQRHQIVQLARQYSLPAAFPHREYVEIGGLISYGTDMLEAYREVGRYVSRILKGTSPSALPVVRATKFELVVNVGSAKSLGLEVPADMLTVADEIID